MPRLQSNISNGDQGKKGPKVANVGSDVAPQKGGDLSQRKGNSQPGAAARRSHIDGRGLGAPVVLDVPPSTAPAPESMLDGHNQVDFADVHGPVRKWSNAEHPGGGNKTPDARTMIRKGMD